MHFVGQGLAVGGHHHTGHEFLDDFPFDWLVGGGGGGFRRLERKCWMKGETYLLGKGRAGQEGEFSGSEGLQEDVVHHGQGAFFNALGSANDGNVRGDKGRNLL